jgi:ABC-2 type transport system ATP-binding protein
MSVQIDSPIITCTGLTKIYETGVKALHDLTLTIERGMSFGLMGENGAGKSTLVRLLMGFIFPTSGQLSVLGETDVRRAHSRIGYLHERPYVELRFTGRRYLTYLAELSDLWGMANAQRVASVLEQVDLGSAMDERLSTYSKGMLQRLSIAQALLTDPELLILDEPTNGLDPYSQWKVRQIIAALRKQGKTILICSHYLAEVEMLCDTVGILHHGQLVQHGAVSDLVRSQDAVEIVLADEQLAADIADRLDISEHVLETEQNLLHIKAVSQQEVLAALVSADIPIRSLNPVSKTLEEVYIHTTRPDAEKHSVQTAAH